MWEMRPVDFYEYYKAYWKKQRQQILTTAILGASGGLGEGVSFEKYHEDLMYALTETERPKQKRLIDELGAGKFDEINNRRIRALKKLEEQRNG
jgi:hypothetical protein